MTVTRSEIKLKFGKGSGFVKSRLKRLPQEDDTWEVDFRVLPKPLMQADTHYVGLVVRKRRGSVLAFRFVEHKPSINDLAGLIANTMRNPLIESSHRPRRIHVRGHRQWRELFPHLEELGIEITVERELPRITKAYQEQMSQLRQAQRIKMVVPSAEQQAVEELFPAIAKWVQGYGHIEIGDQEMFGFVVRALSYGGMVFEDNKPETLAEAMTALEKGLAEYFEREGIE